jgi:hypothetical protein
MSAVKVIGSILTGDTTGRGGAQAHELHPDLPASARRRRLLRFQRRFPSRLPRRVNSDIGPERQEGEVRGEERMVARS